MLKNKAKYAFLFFRSISFLRLLFVVLFFILVHVNNIYLIDHAFGCPNNSLVDVAFAVKIK